MRCGALAHPDRSFRLGTGPNELLAVTPVATMRERVYQVFGSQVLDELVEIGARERDLFLPPVSVPPSQAIAEYRSTEPEDPPMRRFRLNGFFSRPQVQKANRNSIYHKMNDLFSEFGWLMERADLKHLSRQEIEPAVGTATQQLGL